MKEEAKEYDDMLQEIAEDPDLTTKQRAWLIAFFNPSPTTKYRIKESCEAANCSYISCWNWRTKPAYAAFQKYYAMFTDIIVSTAEHGLYSQVEAGFWPATQFALTKLSKTYRENIDITSGGQPITSITIVPISTPPPPEKENE